MPALLPSSSLSRPVPSPVQAALSASTVYAALTDGPVATVLRYVTPPGLTHDDNSTIGRQGPTQPVDHLPEPNASRARQRNQA
jgi:hypothetical protein